MSNPYYAKGSAITPFVLADARDVSNEFAAVESAFDGVTAALTENRLASTSTTSLAIGAGAKTLLIQAGRAFAVGQFVSIARTSDPTNFMAGQVTSYNSTSGVLVVNATETGGSGTFAEWTVALSLPGATASFLRKTGDTMSGPLNLAGDPASDTEAARKAYVDAVTTAAAMLAKLLTVDGSGSAIDADMLDGLHAAAFAQLSGANFTGPLNVIGAGGAYAGMNTNGDITANRGNGTGIYYFTGSGTRYLFWDGSNYYLNGGSLFASGGAVWSSANDGSGSGLDADMLDGLHAAAFARLTGAAYSGDLSVVGAGGAYASMNTAGDIYANRAGGATGIYYFTSSGTRYLYFNGSGFDLVGGQLAINSSIAWNAGNDGSGSGLDADLLDGLDSSYFVNIPARLGYTPVQQGTGIGQSVGNVVKIGWAGSRLKVTVDSTDLGNVVFDANITDVWRASNDGAGSGLDADLLDGQDGSFYTAISARLGYTPLNQASYTAGDVLAKMLTVDGSGSGLDADLLDGLNSTAFLRATDSSLAENNGFVVYSDGRAECWGFIDVAQDSSGSVTFPTRTGGAALFTSWVNVTLGAQTRIGANEAENTGLSGTPSTTGFVIYNAQNQTIRVWWRAIGV